MKHRLLLLLLLPLLASGCLKFGWDRLSTKVPSAVLDTIRPEAIEADRKAVAEAENDRARLQAVLRRFRGLQLVPAGDDDFLHEVPLHLIQTSHAQLSVAGAAWPPDSFLAFTRRNREEAVVAGAGLVFVGHGIVAPESDWDDYAEVDVQGKVVLLLEGDPGTAAGDSTLFRGRVPSVYAGVDYKLEEAARRGAVGALLVPAPGGEDWAARRERVRSVQRVRRAASRRSVEAAAWVRRERARLLFATAGIEIERAEWAARTRGFAGRDLEAEVDLRVRSVVRSTRSFNLAGEVTGRFASERSVLVSAPWSDPAAVAGLLALADAVRELPEDPARSVIFVATAYGEDRHLGAAEYAERPYREAATCAAALALGAVDDVDSTTAAVGAGLSELGGALNQAATEEGRSLLLVPADGDWALSEAGRYAVQGIPAARMEAGAADLRIALRTLFRLAQTQGNPRWTSTSEYRWFPRQ